LTTVIRGLYAIVDKAETALDCLKGGASIVQLRDKKRPESEEAGKRFREAAFRIASLKKDFRFLFIVNDDLDVALEVGADGVHVGKDDRPIEECRQKINLVGYSSHSLEEAIAAERQGANYVAFGAIYPSPTKGHDHPVQGIGRLKEVVSSLKVPVVAIGGINRSNIQEVLKTGAASVAMISALAQAPDRVEEARYFSRFFV
jgi:thiamine-phosphate pyrophosphorylase